MQVTNSLPLLFTFYEPHHVQNQPPEAEDQDISVNANSPIKIKLDSLISDNRIVKSNLQIFMESGGGIYRALDGEKFDRIKYQSRYLSLKKLIESGHPIDPDELKKLNKYMINPLGEDDVLNKIEDIRLHPSRYVQLFQTLPSMIAKSKDPKPRLVNVTDQDNLQDKPNANTTVEDHK